MASEEAKVMAAAYDVPVEVYEAEKARLTEQVKEAFVDAIAKGLAQSAVEFFADKLPRWIPVSERLPEDMEQRVLVFTATGVCGVAWDLSGDGDFYTYDDRFNDAGFYDPATHWMPLPEPPKP